MAEEKTEEPTEEVTGRQAFDEAKIWYESTILVLKTKWEDRLKALVIPGSPQANDIMMIASKIDTVGNDVSLDLAKAKSIRSKLKDDMDTKKAVYTGDITIEHPDWKTRQVLDAVKIRLAKEALMESFHMADAKFNYMLSVAERLKRKKELLATDRDIMNLTRGLHTPHKQ